MVDVLQAFKLFVLIGITGEVAKLHIFKYEIWIVLFLFPVLNYIFGFKIIAINSTFVTDFFYL